MLTTAEPGTATAPEPSEPTRQELTVTRIKSLLRGAGCIPTERDTLYRPVAR